MGNQGMLSGDPSAAGQTPGRPTRKRYVTKIELAKIKKTAERDQANAVEVNEADAAEKSEKTDLDAADSGSEQITQPLPSTIGETTTYTVTANDTLQSISLKFYGTIGKWKRIYEANIDQLRSPDRIYAGQVLKIPKE